MLHRVAMPSEQPNITPLSDLPWSDPFGGFLKRAVKTTIAANCGGLMLFGIVYTLNGDPWTALGSMIFVVAAGAVPALIPSLRLGWRRFALFISVGGSAAVAALVLWAMTHWF